MAGLGGGAGVGRPGLIEKFLPYTAGALPITGYVAATASLKSKTVVPERRKIIGDVRNDVLAFMKQHEFKTVPSVSNKFMVDVRKPANEVILALRKEKLYICLLSPSRPT